MENMKIPFNRPYLTGKELLHVNEVMATNKISGSGKFTKQCHDFFQNRYGFRKCLLTTSCTDALEMAAILLDIQPGDEVIMPSFTFVSTANAFVLRGAKIVFADSMADHPNMDADTLESLITPKTKAIVPVHYAGVACDMDKIMALADKYGLFVVEDAAQAIDSYHLGADGIKRPLGGIGHLAAFSFHETKNIISGEGGMLVVNDERFVQRAEIIWEKGTNRAAFWRGEVDKYGWVDIGSSYLPSEIIAAFLWAQLEQLDDIQSVRLKHWNYYYENLAEAENAGIIKRPQILPWATNNAHMFYLVCNSLEERTALIDKLKKAGVNAVFHYLSLHGSPYYRDKHDGRVLHNSDFFSDVLVRLPMYYELDSESISKVTDSVIT
jgi:dTDP-4-amino-4,6-dideoxygalactose transaminase